MKVGIYSGCASWGMRGLVLFSVAFILSAVRIASGADELKRAHDAAVENDDWQIQFLERHVVRGSCGGRVVVRRRAADTCAAACLADQLCNAIRA